MAVVVVAGGGDDVGLRVAGVAGDRPGELAAVGVARLDRLRDVAGAFAVEVDRLGGTGAVRIVDERGDRDRVARDGRVLDLDRELDRATRLGQRSGFAVFVTSISGATSVSVTVASSSSLTAWPSSSWPEAVTMSVFVSPALPEIVRVNVQL